MVKNKYMNRKHQYFKRGQKPRVHVLRVDKDLKFGQINPLNFEGARAKQELSLPVYGGKLDTFQVWRVSFVLHRKVENTKAQQALALSALRSFVFTPRNIHTEP